jgi:hypothetical protein
MAKWEKGTLPPRHGGYRADPDGKWSTKSAAAPPPPPAGAGGGSKRDEKGGDDDD